MPDLRIDDIPEDAFNKLRNLANRKGLSVESYTKELIFAATRFPSLADDALITFDRFQKNVDLIFAAYNQHAIEVMDARGRSLVLLPVNKYQALTS